MSDLTDLDRYQRALEAAERRGAGAGARGGRDGLLTFESSIELDFLEHRRAESLPLMRFALLLSVAFYVVFFLVDRLMWGRYQLVWALVPIFYIASTVNLLMFGLTWVKDLRPRLGGLAALAVLVNGFAFAFVSAYGYKVGIPIPPEAPVILQTYTMFLLNLGFRLAAPVALMTVTAFVLMHAMVNMDSADYFYRSFMIVAAGLVGALACYLTERTQRLAWLRARLLRELSEHDSLTGLYNHRVFYQRGDQLLRQARREKTGVAVLLCDVDHFKQFNDSHGHLAGDDALRQVSAALSQCARRPLDLVARLGGEEFGLLLFNVTPEIAMARAEDLRNIVRGLTLSHNRRVSISIGVATADNSKVTTIEALIGAADSALYRAKDAGRDRVSV